MTANTVSTFQLRRYLIEMRLCRDEDVPAPEKDRIDLGTVKARLCLSCFVWFLVLTVCGQASGDLFDRINFGTKTIYDFVIVIPADGYINHFATVWAYLATLTPYPHLNLLLRVAGWVLYFVGCPFIYLRLWLMLGWVIGRAFVDPGDLSAHSRTWLRYMAIAIPLLAPITIWALAHIGFGLGWLLDSFYLMILDAAKWLLSR